CLSPEAATPSPTVYRGAILSLVVASAVGLYLIVNPPASEGGGDSVRQIETPTVVMEPTATPTPQGQEPETPTPGPTPTGSPDASPSPDGTPPAGGSTHTVEPGDTLSGIAEQYDVTVEELVAANPGLTDAIAPGDVIVIPE